MGVCTEQQSPQAHGGVMSVFHNPEPQSYQSARPPVIHELPPGLHGSTHSTFTQSSPRHLPHPPKTQTVCSPQELMRPCRTGTAAYVKKRVLLMLQGLHGTSASHSSGHLSRMGPRSSASPSRPPCLNTCTHTCTPRPWQRFKPHNQEVIPIHVFFLTLQLSTVTKLS